MRKPGYIPLLQLLLGMLLGMSGYSPALGQARLASPPLPSLPLRCLPAGAANRYAPLRQALGAARVVLLGEQSHFDGTTFEAKIDLIRFLHDSLGFNTLAFEGDMYALDKARREIAAGQPVLPALQKSVYEGIWSGTAEFQALAAYLTTHPALHLAGFDCQLSGEYSAEQLLPELRSFVSLDPRTKWQAADFYPAQELLAELAGGDFKQQLLHPADTVQLTRWFGRTRESLRYIAAHLPAQASRAAFWQQWLQTTARYAQDAKSEACGRKEVAQNSRDALLASNLLYLARQPEHAKIIVWAASYHVANRLEQLELDDAGTAAYVQQLRRQQHPPADDEPLTARRLLGGAVPMGRLVKQALGSQAYAIGFVAYEGTYGRTGDTTSLRPVLMPPPSSVEVAFRQLGCDWGFVNLQNSPPGSYYASALGYLPLRGPWGKVFDGLFFTRTMHPTTALAPASVAAAPAAGQKLLGQVQDAGSGAAISFASVGIRGTAVGTVTNLEGGFVLLVPAAHAYDTVQVSCLGYASARLSLARQPAAPLRIRLVPQGHLLGEVVVKAPLSAAAILAKAREHITINYLQQAHSMQLYSRAQYWRDDSLRVQREAALDGYDQEGYRRGSWEHASKQRFLQMRQQRKTGDATRPEYQEAPDFWLLWSDDPVLTTRNPLEAGPAVKYSFTLKGETRYNNRTVYEVGFVCNQPSAFTTPYGYPAPDAYKGSVYVDAENFAVVKYEAFTTRRPKELAKPREFTYYGFTQPATEYRTHHDVYQYEEVKGTYFRQYARRETARKFVLRDSTQHRWQDVHELLTTSVELRKPLVLQTSLYHVDTNVPYREEFWNTYQGLLPTSGQLVTRPARP